MLRFLAEDFLTVGHDSSVSVSLKGVLVRLGVRPSQDGQGSRDVELVISTQNTEEENVCIWSEQVIRSYKPAVPSLRSKLCQVYSSSQHSQTCRLSSFDTLTDPAFGYLDLKGYATLSLR